MSGNALNDMLQSCYWYKRGDIMNSVTTNSKWLKVDGKKLYEKRRKKN